MAKPDGLFQEWSRRYLFEYLTALVLCIAASWVCIPLARAASSQSTRLSFLAAPTAAILIMTIVVFRHFRRVDEFLQRLMVNCFATAGAFTLVWTLSYGIFEIAGLPKISMWWAFGGAVLVWNLSMVRAIAAMRR